MAFLINFIKFLFISSFSGLLLGRSDSIDSTASSLLFDGLDSSSFSSHWNGGHPGGGGVGGGGGFGFKQPQQVAKLAEKLNRFAPTEVGQIISLT